MITQFRSLVLLLSFWVIYCASIVIDDNYEKADQNRDFKQVQVSQSEYDRLTRNYNSNHQTKLVPYTNYYYVTKAYPYLTTQNDYYSYSNKPILNEPIYSQQNITPFSEENALPGKFIPIVTKTQHVPKTINAEFYQAERFIDPESQKEAIINISNFNTQFAQYTDLQEEVRPNHQFSYEHVPQVRDYTVTQLREPSKSTITASQVSKLFGIQPSVPVPQVPQYVLKIIPSNTLNQYSYRTAPQKQYILAPYLTSKYQNYYGSPKNTILRKVPTHQPKQSKVITQEIFEKFLVKPRPSYINPNKILNDQSYTNVRPEKRPTTYNRNVISMILQNGNSLPDETLRPYTVDNSIKTLLQILKNFDKPQQYVKPIIVAGNDNKENNPETPSITQSYPIDTVDGGTPGIPGIDYPALSTIPPTTFSCKDQRYKGFFGDPHTNCQVWHYCDLNGGQASFLCPNGTIFSQVSLTCDWWYNVKCSSTPQLYVLNERLYKYILPLTPKFPEDYTGPLVDKYLTLKFKEMENKTQKPNVKEQDELNSKHGNLNETVVEQLPEEEIS